MSKLIKLDPEIQAIYDAQVMPRESKFGPTQSHSVREEESSEEIQEDEFQALRRIAEENRSQYVDRKTFKDGSFDQVEHDVSNVVRIGWNLLTR